MNDHVEPTPERLAIARRAASRQWTVGPKGAAAIEGDPDLAVMVTSGLVYLHYTAAYRLTDDYWALTDAGRNWLAEHATDTEEG